MKRFKESELIINPDGSVYHIKLRPEEIADTVLLVGDQGRVKSISKYFDTIEHQSQNREFMAHTGSYKGRRITALSTGIGTDNIDIVVNELDAAVNIDLKTRALKDDRRRLKLIRLGTSGAIQPDIDVDTFVASGYGLGFDGLLHFYKYDPGIVEKDMVKAFVEHTGWDSKLPYPYIVKNSGDLLETVAYGMTRGVTATASGFFGPQGRQLRIPLAYPRLNNDIESFEFENKRIINFEMETSALYALGKILGHETLTICAVIANRPKKKHSTDYKKTVDKLIHTVLERLAG